MGTIRDLLEASESLLSLLLFALMLGYGLLGLQCWHGRLCAALQHCQKYWAV